MVVLPVDPVMPGVGDEESVAGRVGPDLARKAEGAASGRQGVEREPAAMHQTRRVVLADRFDQQVADRFQRELALVLAPDASGRVDEHQGGPGADGVALPDRVVGVVHDRMVDP